MDANLGIRAKSLVVAGSNGISAKIRHSSTHLHFLEREVQEPKADRRTIHVDGDICHRELREDAFLPRWIHHGNTFRNKAKRQRMIAISIASGIVIRSPFLKTIGPCALSVLFSILRDWKASINKLLQYYHR
jgi:hypothetical protein